MQDILTNRLTWAQRWRRLRTSYRFPFLVFAGLMLTGLLVQVGCFWWDVQIQKMLSRVNGSCNRLNLYPARFKQAVGYKYVSWLEPIVAVNLGVRPDGSVSRQPGDFGWLRGMFFLRELTVDGQLTAEEVSHMKRWTGLTKVSCFSATEGFFEAVPRWRHLQELHVYFKSDVRANEFSRIASLPRLERLTCYLNNQLTSSSEVADVYRELAASRTLKRLNIDADCPEQFIALTSDLSKGEPPFQNLRELRIGGSNKMAPTDLARLKNLPCLIHLDLSYCGITDQHLPALKELPYLRTLYLESNPNVTDTGATVLASMTGLQCLNVKQTRITMAGYLQLATLPRLRCLRGHPSSIQDMKQRLPPGCELDTN